MIAKKLKEIVGQAAGVDPSEVHLEHPELAEHGDYSTNIALTKDARSKMLDPRSLASKIYDLGSDILEKVEVAGPGFINIWLRDEFLVKSMADAAQLPATGKGKTVVVEYSSPNIAKPFGIGHFRSTVIGQALYNIYKSLGYTVIGDNHLGDWGTQFGKLLYMIDLRKPTELSIELLEKLYVEFHQHPEWETEGRRWFKKLEDGDKEARDLWQKCVDISMTEFNRIYALLSVKIDDAYGESSYESLMSEVIKDAEKTTKVSEGAQIVEIPGLETPLMLLKSDGGTTYATRDLATVKFRKNKWHPDLVIYEVGAEQTLHFQQVFAGAHMLGYVTDKDSLIHTKHGLYLDTDGKKFATRQGKTIKLEEVLLEAVEKAKSLGSADEVTAKAVGVGAIKYFDLSHGVQSNIVFDWDKILALEGNSGPYLQYTYARTQSVLKKAESAESAESAGQLNPEELSIIRFLYRYSEIVQGAASRFAPNLLTNFLYELAQRFNTFYNKYQILGNDLRLKLTKSTGEVLQSGLNLLGIEALDHM